MGESRKKMTKFNTVYVRSTYGRIKSTYNSPHCFVIFCLFKQLFEICLGKIGDTDQIANVTRYFIKDRLEEPRQLGQISAYSFVTRFFLRLPVLYSCMHNDDIIVKLFYSKFCTNE